MLRGSFHVVLEPSQQCDQISARLLGLLPPSIMMARGSFSLERSCGKAGYSNHASDVSLSLAWLQSGWSLPYQGLDSGDG